MNSITSWLDYTFMRNALLAILVITPLFGLLGTMIVQMHSVILP